MKTPLLTLLALLLLVVNPNNCAATQAAVPETGQANQPSQSTNTKTDPEKKKKKKFPPRGAIVVAPLPIVSPAIGAGIIPAVGYIFPFGKDDKISPPPPSGQPVSLRIMEVAASLSAVNCS